MILVCASDQILFVCLYHGIALRRIGSWGTNVVSCFSPGTSALCLWLLTCDVANGSVGVIVLQSSFWFRTKVHDLVQCGLWVKLLREMKSHLLQKIFHCCSRERDISLTLHLIDKKTENSVEFRKAINKWWILGNTKYDLMSKINILQSFGSMIEGISICFLKLRDEPRLYSVLFIIKCIYFYILLLHIQYVTPLKKHWEMQHD